MVKCPECEADIEYLKNWQSGEQCYHLELNRKGEEVYDGGEFVPDNQVNDFECPECGSIIATSEGKAIAFLKGKKK